jgi:hypothetical protein
MGLDLVELTMEMEDEFAISIPDETAAALTTIGATIDFIVADLRRRDGVCLTARAFYRVRQGLVARCRASRSDVRLDAPIRPLVGKRRREWAAIATHAGLRVEAPLPPEEASLRDVITRNIVDFRCHDGSVDEVAVAQRVFELVSEQTSVPIAKLRRDSRYIDDLRMG